MIRSSFRMRARTGKAVIDVTTPQKRSVEPKEPAVEGKVVKTGTDAAAPSPKGTTIPVNEIASDLCQLRFRTLKGSSTPTQNMNRRRL
jgi:hypothetical protein